MGCCFNKQKEPDVGYSLLTENYPIEQVDRYFTEIAYRNFDELIASHNELYIL